MMMMMMIIRNVACIFQIVVSELFWGGSRLSKKGG